MHPDDLLASGEEPAHDPTADWSSELLKRSREIAQGSVQVTPWEAAYAQTKAELARRRAGRSPSPGTLSD